MHSTLAIGLFAVLLLSTLLGLDSSIVPGLSAKNAFLYVIIGLMVVQLAISKERVPAPASRPGNLFAIHILFLLLVVYCAISMTTVLLAGGYTLPELPGGAGTRLMIVAIKNQVIDQYLFLLVFVYASRSVDNVKTALLVVMGLVAASNLLTVIDGFNVPDLGLIQEKQGGRIQGPLGEHSQYGAYIAAFLPGIIAAAMVSSGLKRVLFSIGAMVSLMALLMTASRGAIVGLVVGSLLSLVYLRNHISMLKTMRFAVVGTLIGALAIGIVGLQFGDLLEERFVEQSQVTDLDSLTSERSTIWAEALGNMAEHPRSFLFGYGWGAFEANIIYASHNTYLDYFYDLGLIGLLLYVGIWATLLQFCRSALDVIEDRDSRIVVVAFVFGLMAALISIFFVNLLKPVPYIWSYAGLVLALCRLTMLEQAKAAVQPPSRAARRAVRQESWASRVAAPKKAARH